MSTRYDFDADTHRWGSNCYKWDDCANADTIPLWVADMDFGIAPEISAAIAARAQHPVFGYTKVPQSFYDSIIRWHKRRHRVDIHRDEIIYTIGVVPAISAIIKALATPGDGVMVLTPVYNCFFSSIRNNGCQVVEVPLQRTGDTYAVDYAGMERAMSSGRVRLMLLCNPHNPAGRVWTPEELRHIGDICRAHGVTIVADEIHSGIIMPGHTFTSFASLGDDYRDMCVLTTSSSKSFNTAGLQMAYIVTRNAEWRAKIDKAININEVCDVNPFGVEALMAAYDQGEEWLEEMCQYVWGNYKALCRHAAERWPRSRVMLMEGTYLAWVDISQSGQSTAQVNERLLKESNVRVSPGTIYGSAGEGFVRLNLACPRHRLMEALQRMDRVMC